MDWIKDWVKKHSSNLALPVLALIVLGLAYGLQLSKLGYYLDDWIILEAFKMGGVERLREYTFLGNRPLVYPIWLIGFKLAGANPFIWQIWSLFWRWATVCTIWLVFRKLWPKQSLAIILAALLFSVYPIFDQQPSALTYSFHWITFFLWGLSFLFTLIAAETYKDNKWKSVSFILISILLDSLQMFTQEFFLGLEILRPLGIWIILSRQKSAEKKKTARINKTIIFSLPYFFLLGIYLVWRLKIMPVPTAGDRNSPVILYGLFTNFFSTILQLIDLTVQSLLEGIAGSWYQALAPQTFVINKDANFLSWVIVFILFLLGTGIVFLISKNFPKENTCKEEVKKVNYLWMAGFGLLFFLCGIAPGLSKGSYLSPTVPTSDRFAFAAMPGAVLLITALIFYLFQSNKWKSVFLILLISLASGYHFRIANEYRHSWEKQLRLFWQLSWRIPDLEKNTALLGNGALATGMGSWATASALNLMYADYENPKTVDYWYVDLYRQAENLQSPDPLELGSIQMNFLWNKENSVVFQYEVETSPCLWVLDEQDRSNPDLDPYVQKGLSTSNLDLILTESDPRPLNGNLQNLIRKENEMHNWWCYYYQKADLAEQTQDWDTILEIWDEADNQNLKAYASPEYMPFIHAAGLQADWELAISLTQQAAFLTNSTSQICTIWEEIQSQNFLPEDYLHILQEDYSCTNLK